MEIENRIQRKSLSEVHASIDATNQRAGGRHWPLWDQPIW